MNTRQLKKKLHSLFKATGRSQIDVADAIGVQRVALYRMFSDYDQPSFVGSIIRVADELGYELQLTPKKQKKQKA